MIKKLISLTLCFVMTGLLGSYAPASVSAEEPPALQPIQITELLPDPAAPQADNEYEYIELYNPNGVAIDLAIYTLHSGSQSSTREFALTGIILQPGEYRAFYASQTGLNLVNASSGQAWLVGPGFVRVSETPWYPAGMGENKAWAFVGGDWQVTEALSPGAANPLPPLDPPATPPSAESTDQPEPCPEGKYRNPETNRCKTVEEPQSLTPCGPGQERNPATNRCRAAASSTTLTPCDAGEERNPDTNRCRKSVTATTPSDCQMGYERNAETNRCRKVQDVKAAVTSQPGGSSKTALNFWLIGGVSTLVLGYGLYEYRRDIAMAYTRLKGYVKPGKR